MNESSNEIAREGGGGRGSSFTFANTSSFLGSALLIPALDWLTVDEKEDKEDEEEKEDEKEDKYGVRRKRTANERSNGNFGREGERRRGSTLT
jgi:hypothetical protein